MEVTTTLGKRLREQRELMDLTQEEVAQGVGITAAVLSNYERGTRDPDTETLKRLADFFDTTTDYLLGRTNDPKSHKPDDAVIAASRADDPLTDLPEKARKSLEEFIRHVERKYAKEPEGNKK